MPEHADDLQWAPPPPSRQPAGPLLAGYSDLVEVARGGDSVVYRARQDALRRDVAIKVIDVTDPATLARFDRELQITVALGRQHPHIISVLDTGTTSDGRACLVMDFHDLGSLHDRLRAHGPLPAAEVVAAGVAVADALDFAHHHDVLHRDIKPQNILLLPTSYVLTDFGIARMADAGHTASLERLSYRHASPQVLDGLEPTPADDVWSLGSTLFTLVDGRPPFSSDDAADDTALAYLRRVRTAARRTVDRPGVPTALLCVIEACLAADRADRPPASTIRDLLRAVPTELSSWAPGTPPLAEPASPAGPQPSTDHPPAPRAKPSHGAPSSPAPSVPAPSVLAPSALAAQLRQPRVAEAGSAADADAEPTGLYTGAAVAGGAEPHAAAVSARVDEAPRRRWPALVGFIGGAVLLGSLVGTGAVMLADRERPAATEESPAPTAAPVDEAPAGTGTPTDPLDLSLSDPAVAPADLVLVDQGTSVTASWTDPTAGQVVPVLIDVTDPDRPLALDRVAAGVTERTLEGIDPDAPSFCVVVVGIDAADPERYGVSEVVCVER